MAWNSITLTLTNPADAASVEDQLLSLGAQAVTYTDAGDEPILEPELHTQPLWSQTNINALFDLDIDLADIKSSLVEEFGKDAFVIIDQGQIEDKVWEREWLSHFKPMRFGERLWICPADMHIPEDQKTGNDVIVDMEPGLAFGTGTHETTAMCLTWLDHAKLRNKTILDYGCGSGILAIAALKLGAKKATCLDIDIQAIESCLENAQRNGVQKKLVAYLPDDSDWPADDTYDVILANILSAPLIALAQDIRRRVSRGGHIVLSGILATQSDQVQAAYSPYFNLNEPDLDGDWVCISGQLKTSTEILGDKELVTHCPNCDESFYINAKDIDRANGRVRCGECSTVFFAMDFIDAVPDESISNLNNPIDSGIIPKAHLITGLWIQSKDGLTPVEQNMQSQASAKEEQDTSEAESEEQFFAELNKDDANIDRHQDFDPMADNTLTDISFEDDPQLHPMDKDLALDIDDLEALTQPKRSGKNILWLLLAVLGFLALAAQYLHQHRNQLALHPTLGQPIQSLYSHLPFELEPDWQLDAYTINASTVALNPQQKNQLIASFNLSNTAKHAQIFPLIRLSLFNRWGERIAYRDLSVEDYLPDNKQTASDKMKNASKPRPALLAAQGRVDVKIAVLDPGAKAMDYNVEVCLDKSGTIRCQDKIY